MNNYLIPSEKKQRLEYPLLGNRDYSRAQNRTEELLAEIRILDEKYSVPLNHKSIPKEARTARRQLFDKIKTDIPEEQRTVLNTAVYAHERLNCFGRCGTINGERVLFVDSMIAKLQADLLEPLYGRKGYNEWVNLNKRKNPNPLNFFQYILAHELGHDLDDMVSKSNTSNLGYTCFPPFSGSTNAESEGFAFWFGEGVTGFETFDKTINGYKNPEIIRKIISTLRTNQRKEGIKETISKWPKIRREIRETSNSI